MDPKSEALSRIPLLEGLSATEYAALAQRAVERRYQPDETLFWEGEPCSGIYLLVEGSVKLLKSSSAGREMMLAMETAPSTVAELPLFDGGPYPASARAVGPLTTLFINKADFHHVCRQFPEIALKVLAVVGRRLRHLVGIVHAMTFGSVTQRFARLILDTAGQAGADEFAFDLTHQELALRLGTVREVVSRNLARFRTMGLLKLEGGRLRILDRAGLERESEEEG